MAVFRANVCRFNSCGIKFTSLQDLIRHIEEIHLDFEPRHDISANSNALPVSCILRIFPNRNHDLNGLSSSIDLHSNTLNESLVRKSINSPAVSLSTTPTDGSELDGEDADSDSGQSSIDSWANANGDSSTNPLLKFHQIMGSSVSGQSLDENNNRTKLQNGVVKQELICGYAGCQKSYRNSNSLSHHKKSAHKIGNITPAAKPVIDESNKKIYNCTQCNKTYKTSHGLKNHCNNHHNQMKVQAVNGTPSLAIASNAQEIKQEMPAQASFVQITSTKPDFSTDIKGTFFNPIPKGKNITSVVNGDFVKFKNGAFSSIQCADLIADNNCPPVSSNVEVISEPKSKCPPFISAPTLQQHLLSPIIPKIASN